ncbi:translocase of chloroplast 33, chloroplastic-like isoform X2 [Hibiscus syriacus]|uniref:translocase of chloroplast 33, chloroplastic-like isoform X2 n=1 Tax=Hibiscus syriacus TaxID=106335 RepID=UPI00192238E8|nr:translocase of chloroplast 33, chloroplastic-like isoform X2 [Hibiscus syriacus]
MRLLDETNVIRRRIRRLTGVGGGFEEIGACIRVFTFVLIAKNTFVVVKVWSNRHEGIKWADPYRLYRRELNFEPTCSQTVNFDEIAFPNLKQHLLSCSHPLAPQNPPPKPLQILHSSFASCTHEDRLFTVMSTALPREWLGLQQFPVATQTKLFDLLGKLKQENVNTLTILVMGKGGVGKSSTINSLLGEQVVRVTAFQSEGLRPVMASRTWAGFTLNVIDTPGLVEAGYVNYQALQLIKGFLLNKSIDVLLYVDRLDAYRVDDLDKQVIRAISNSFGKEIWRKSFLVLTHAQLCPPDGLNYDVFSSKRSESVLKAIRIGARIRKKEFDDSVIPVVLVENSGRCNKNDNDEKILPNGEAWILNLVKAITTVATNKCQVIVVSKKLVDGSDVNDKGKLWIPVILGLQWVFIKWIQGAIKRDIATGNGPK